MTTSKRTGDDEGRIVPGGELPEGDNSLDDVVVEPPQQNNSDPTAPKKEPDELWTSYLARRLADEGIYLGEFENDMGGAEEIDYSCVLHRLNSGLMLHVSRHFDLDKLKAVTRSTRAGSLFNLSEIIDYEDIILVFDGGIGEETLHLNFHYDNNTTKADFNNASPEFRQLPFIRNYEPNKFYQTEQVITDLVKYIKETGIKK